MLTDAPCANHSDRRAEIVCARCGTFVCQGCVVSGDLCAECKTRLLRDKTPWTAEEKARASARACLRWSHRLVTPVLVSSGAGLFLHLAAGDGVRLAAGLGVVFLVAGALFGAAMIGLAGRGYVTSERGRPGPAVPGIVSKGSATFLAAVGASAVTMAVALVG